MDPSSTQSTVSYKYCDLVMKGGITSGVVYPTAAVKLSSEYRFKNIGGTSAGAIAAAVTAAAEFGRRNGNAQSFDVLNALPGDLANNGHLLKLFTPDKRTRKVFSIAIGVMGSRTVFGKIVTTLLGIVRASMLWFAGGFVPGLVAPTLFYAWLRWHALQAVPQLISHHPGVCVFSGLPLAIALGFILACIHGGVSAIRGLASNGFGLCSGMASSSTDADGSLTGWIEKQVQVSAGRTETDAPVTFGDLWKAPAYPGETLQTARTINLQVVTTGLTEGRPFTIPFLDGALYFDPEELGTLFPPTVVTWLIKHGQAAEKKKHPPIPGVAAQGDARPVSSPSKPNVALCRLPDNEDLPILVATRMSLSFPGLLSAVPLYRVDYGTSRNQGTNGDYPTRIGTKVWFSDGGICSNFPINFFDSPLPRWPTFGINLQQADAATCNQQPRDPARFVWLPKAVGAVKVVWNWLGDTLWTPDGIVEQKSPGACIARFASSIMNTMQNWRDNLQAASPGYRDRIVTVELCPDEGGLNLNMPDALVASLSQRGEQAGKVLLDNFDFSQHIFTRFRVTLCALQTYLDSLDDSYSNPLVQDSTGWSYVNGQATPPHYKWDHPAIERRAVGAVNELIALSAAWQAYMKEPEKFCTNAPRPEAVLQGRPNF